MDFWDGVEKRLAKKNTGVVKMTFKPSSYLKAILSTQSLLVQFPLTMTVLSKHFTKSKVAN